LEVNEMSRTKMMHKTDACAHLALGRGGFRHLTL
jgi:hypothetical protein